MTSVDNNWGRWGEADEKGALNLITPELTKAAARSVRTGKVYSLGIPIQSSGVPLLGYRGTPMRLTLLNDSDEGFFALFGAAAGTGANEDIVQFASHTTTHIDALCHVYEEKKYYNGVPESKMKIQTGARKLRLRPSPHAQCSSTSQDSSAKSGLSRDTKFPLTTLTSASNQKASRYAPETSF